MIFLNLELKQNENNSIVSNWFICEICCSNVDNENILKNYAKKKNSIRKFFCKYAKGCNCLCKLLTEID